MFDVVIRGGAVVDGSGSPERIADVAIQEGLIVGLGAEVGRGHREVDATGMLVTPGFVDPHTHYDGQVTWDGSTPTPSNGPLAGPTSRPRSRTVRCGRTSWESAAPTMSAPRSTT